MAQLQCPDCGSEHFVRMEARVVFYERYVLSANEKGEATELGEAEADSVPPWELVPGKDLEDVPMADVVGPEPYECMGCRRSFASVPTLSD